MKEEKKKNTKKSTTTKVVKKKTTKKVPAKQELNETVKIDSENTALTKITSKDNIVECKFCHKPFEKGYTICPNCHKRQNNVAFPLFIIFVLVFILCIICFHFVEQKINPKSNIDYKETCKLVDYEGLVRVPKAYKNKDVKVIGKITSIEGYDSGFANEMIITININLFEDSTPELVTINFKDKNYEQGFLVGDMITVYGKYTNINGNTPEIEAKYIVLGK